MQQHIGSLALAGVLLMMPGGVIAAVTVDTFAVLRFDPETARFESFPGSGPGAGVRQILGREGEVWAPESGRDTLVRFRLE